MRALLLPLCAILAAASFESQLDQDFLDFSFNELEHMYGLAMTRPWTPLEAASQITKLSKSKKSWLPQKTTCT